MACGAYSNWSRREEWRLWLLCFMQMTLAIAQRNRTILQCYCNIGESCDLTRNICGDMTTSNCHSRIDHENGAYKLVHFCGHSLTACPTTTHCCRTKYCNMCPEWEIYKESIEVLARVEFPSECNITFTLPATTTQKVTVLPTFQTGSPWWISVVAVLGVLVVIVMIVACGLWYSYVWMRRRQKSCEIGSIGHLEVALDDGSSRREHTQLKIKTFAQSIKDKKLIGQGSYGRVYCAYADYYGRDVAIKIIPNRNSKSWERERDIYRTDMLNHPNILAFITDEFHEVLLDINLWLVFEYHARGSLSSYLSTHIISLTDCHKFLSSIADGISYLHSHIATAMNHAKSTIAHRDLKTGNILVKNDMYCCISDFGMSVKESDFSSEGEVPDLVVGTKRYLAPEILSGTIQKCTLYSYVMADVYSLALVMWEVTRRCNWRGSEHEVPPYEAPYSCTVPDHPTIEEMKKIVVDDEGRPFLEPAWKNSEFMSQVSVLIQDSWRPNPNARINAAKISRSLRELHPVVYGTQCLNNQI